MMRPLLRLDGWLAHRLAPERWGLWIAISFGLKLALFAFFLKFFAPPSVHSIPGFWGNWSNDTGGYLGPVEDALSTRSPAPLFGSRMVGYGLPYLVLRLFADPAPALNALIVVQMLLASLALYALALLAFRLFNSHRCFLATFAGYFLIPTVSFYDTFALTESFAASSLLIALYLVVCRQRRRELALAGACFAWSVFLRPAFVALGAVFTVFIACRVRTQRSTYAGTILACFLVPLALTDALWAAGRRASGATSHLFLPQASALGPVMDGEHMHSTALVEFLMAVGADWELRSWFYERTSVSKPPCDVETTAFNCASLHALKQRVLRTQLDRSTFNPATPLSEIIAENLQINASLRQYTRSVREEHPLHYHLVAPIHYFVRLVGQSAAHRLFGENETMNPRYRPVRLALDIWVWGLQAGFLLLLPRCLRRSADRLGTAFVACVIFYFYLGHPLLFRSNEFRYVIPALPVLTMLVVSSIFAPSPAAGGAAGMQTLCEELPSAAHPLPRRAPPDECHAGRFGPRASYRAGS